MMTQTEARALVIRANDAYLGGSITRGQRNADLRLIAKASGYSHDEAGVAALITDLLDPR
jgi:hypothetical protein